MVLKELSLAVKFVAISLEQQVFKLRTVISAFLGFVVVLQAIALSLHFVE